MKNVFRTNAALFTGLAIAAFTLFASWFIQQDDLLHLDTITSLMISGALSGFTVFAATLVGLGIVSRHQP